MTDSRQSTKSIAFYLPQFHPIPENDEWWGKGFTEWTNVVKARTLFPGHLQPNVPADLGFYDLRLPESRQAQADLARQYGIGGFCYWHYWFAGRRLLERPFNEVLASGKPDFPFCLGWANESWTGIWHGSPGTVLMEQTYPGAADEEAHFNAVLPAFRDPRYLTIDGRPIFYVYKPQNLPEPRRFVDHWQALARRAGLSGIYFVGEDVYVDERPWDPSRDGFDAVVANNPGVAILRLNRQLTPTEMAQRLYDKMLGRPVRYDYASFVDCNRVEIVNHDFYPCVLPNWDNTPRSGAKGYVLDGSTPELFRRQLRQALRQVANRPADRRLIFIKSWNEWAEGNYLEPDLRNGRAYLEVCRDELAAAL